MEGALFLLVWFGVGSVVVYQMLNRRAHRLPETTRDEAMRRRGTRSAIKNFVEKRQNQKQWSERLVFMESDGNESRAAAVSVDCPELGLKRWRIRRPDHLSVAAVLEEFLGARRLNAWRAQSFFVEDGETFPVNYFESLNVLESDGEGRVWIEIAPHYAPYTKTVSKLDGVLRVLNDADTNLRRGVAAEKEAEKTMASAQAAAARREAETRRRDKARRQAMDNQSPSEDIEGAQSVSPEGAPVPVPSRLFVVEKEKA